jgi:hypothetical protein
MSELIETVTGHPAVEGGEFIVLRGELADRALMFSWGMEENAGQYRVAGAEAFLTDFELVGDDFLGDPADSFYQVILFTTVYRRKSDGKLFGCSYYGSPGNDSIEYGNEGMNPYEALGVSWDWESDEPEPLVLLPVREFHRVGYEVMKPSSTNNQ